MSVTCWPTKVGSECDGATALRGETSAPSGSEDRLDILRDSDISWGGLKVEFPYTVEIGCQKF